MRVKQIALFAGAALMSFSVYAQEREYVMSCDEIVTQLNREATDEAKARFANLAGSCLGVVDRDGQLFMHTNVVVRRVRGNNVTLYLPATDRTFEVDADPSSRVVIAGRKVRPRDLSRGQELNIYVPVEEFTQPIIDEVAFVTEEDDIVVAPAVVAAALPTTG